ncbi:MAG TPA: ferritin family protein [Phycisphaerae bacterium]|nr:ferritin family protein [Phycisphaerae bacterium]
MITFNADEIFEMAEQIERNGSAFYKKAAEITAHAGYKKLLAELSEWELQHEKTFHKIRTGLSGAAKAQGVADPDGEAALYLQAFAAGKVFDPKAEPAAQLTGAESMETILRTALGLEKDSIVFYLGLRQAVPANRGGQKVEAIIEEEMKHIRMLSEQLGAL